jgi:hypothetical protein
MNLSELEPRWIHPNVFVFLCPHCKQELLSCKNVPMTTRTLFELFANTLGDDWNKRVMVMKADFAWTFSGPGPIKDGYQVGVDFARLTVTPSIDASASGHWHGFITKGEII